MKQTNTKIFTKKKFNTQEAQKFADQRAYEINETLTAPLRCIDDRDQRTKEDQRNPLPPFAIPGGGLGFLIGVLSGTREFEKKTKANTALSSENIIRAVEAVIGKMSYHTDAEHEKDPNSRGFAGCGHCAGNFPELPKSDQEYIIQSYLPELKNAGIKPTIYKGEHNASAVMIIDDESIGLHSTDGVNQVYVFHKQHQDRLVNAVSEKIALLYGSDDAPSLTPLNPPFVRGEIRDGTHFVMGEIRDAAAEFEKAKAAELRKKIKNAAQAHLKKTLHHLAANLPKFMVKKNKEENIIVEPMSV